MSKTNPTGLWAVYQRTWTVKKKSVVSSAVCGQDEWEALDLAEPGVHTLVRAGIGSEREAEELARGTSGDAYRGAGRSGSIRTIGFG